MLAQAPPDHSLLHSRPCSVHGRTLDRFSTKLQPIEAKATPHLPRRTLFSITPFLFLPDVGKLFIQEFELWRQEAGYISRRAQETVNPNAPSLKDKQVVASPPLNEELAKSLLEIPLQAAQDVADDAYPGPVSYDAQFNKLKMQELPYFEAYAACGTCGKQGLSEAAWFNFLSYIQYKTLHAGLQPSQVPRLAGNGFEYLHRNSVPMMLDVDDAEEQNGTNNADPDDPQAASLAFFADERGRAKSLYQRDAGTSSSSRSSSSSITTADPSSIRVAAFRAAVGRRLLQLLESSDDPLTAAEREVLALRTPQLDVIRQGVRALLNAMQRLGFLGHCWLTAFGISGDEFENHTVWALGEPAFVKIWIQGGATEKSETALQAEQGWSQDFVFLLLAAYLQRCGVSARGLKRFPYVTQSQLVSEQFTIRRSNPRDTNVSEEPTEAEAAVLSSFPSFSLDKCPGRSAWDGLAEEAALEDAVGC